MRNLKSDRDTDDEGKQKTVFNPTGKQQVAQAFAENDIGKQDKPAEPENRQSIAKNFAENKQDKTLTETERIRQAWAKERENNRTNDLSKDIGYEPD